MQVILSFILLFQAQANRPVYFGPSAPATCAIGSQFVNTTTHLRYDCNIANTWTAASSGITTPVSVANGGTGVATLTGIPLASGTSAFTAITTSSGLAGALSDETGTGAAVFANTPTLVSPILGTPTSGTLTNTTGFPTANLSGLGTGVATFLATPSSANLLSAMTTSTGTGSLVFGTAPTITLANGTGLPISTGVSGLATGIATFLATPSSSNLISAVTDETGTGNLVFSTSPTFTTPILGTPTSGTLTNATGLPISTGVSGLGTNVATFLATPSSANLLAAITDETGTGAAVFGTSPTITTSAQINGYLNLGTGTTGSTYILNIVPTSGATASSTALIQDATATTGSTKLVLKAGAGQSSNNIFEFQRTNASVIVSIADSAGGLMTLNGIGSSAEWSINTSRMQVLNSYQFKWSSTSAFSGTPDIGFGRNAAGVAEVNNGTACSTVANCRDLTLRHIIANGTVPTVASTTMSSCGTTNPTIVGNDMAGKVTVGSISGTSCTITFGTAWTNAPSCHSSNETTGNLMRPTSTTTTLVIAGTMVAGDVIAYGCMGY